MAQRPTGAPADPFTPPQLEVRRPVWSALGELYLDTDTRPEVPRVAWVLAASGLSETELAYIWQDEVTPALAFNLNVVGGEWGYFDLDWLEDRIVRRQRYVRQLPEPPTFTRWLRHLWDVYLWPSEMRRSFQVVMELRGELLALPPPQRQARAEVWRWCAHHYFWPDTPLAQARPAGEPDTERVFTTLEPQLRLLLNAADGRAMPPEQRGAHVLRHLRGGG